MSGDHGDLRDDWRGELKEKRPMRSGGATSGRWLIGVVAIGVLLLLWAPGWAGWAGNEDGRGLVGAQETAATPDATPAPPPRPPAVTIPQPSFDGLRLQQDGVILPYGVWYQWPPLLLTTPDGGAWAFFTAQAHKDEREDALRLYAARFDVGRGVWLPATPLTGGAVQFGPAAAVAPDGSVHLLYSDRASDAPDAYGTLVYTRTNAAGGWEAPIVVAANPNAGHQMMPAVAFDARGQLHALWRDQRNVTPEQRAASPAFGDIFASDLTDGVWSAPIQVNTRPSADLHAAWPHLATDGERLVAVWSVYKGTTAEELNRPATRVEWSARPLADPATWAAPTPVIEREAGDIGGFLVDLAADPRGGVLLVYSRVFKTGNESMVDVLLRRLDAAAAEWGPHLKMISGDLGYFPSLAVAGDGTVYVGFNYGRDRRVEVGTLVLRPDATRVSPLLLVTAGEEGEQGRPSVAAGADGGLWLLYMHAEPESRFIELRATRGVALVE